MVLRLAVVERLSWGQVVAASESLPRPCASRSGIPRRWVLAASESPPLQQLSVAEPVMQPSAPRVLLATSSLSAALQLQQLSVAEPLMQPRAPI
jgi:hypothetical protein